MFTYDTEKRVEIADFFYSNERSIVQTQRNYRRHFNVREAPSDNMIRNLINRLEETGSVTDLLKKGPRNTVRTALMVESVMQSVQEDPTTSTHRHVCATWYRLKKFKFQNLHFEIKYLDLR